VPALVLEDGLVLTDNAAIAAYAEARWPEPALLGTSPAERAEVASWQWRVEFEGLMAVAEALRNGSPAMARRALPGPRDYEQIPALAERGRLRVAHFLELLEERLQGRETIAGGGFSIADITAVVAVDFARIVRIKPGEQHPNLHRWREAMAARPSMSL
jgi:glutathione S-transferase